MGANSPLSKTLELEPVDVSTPAIDEARPAATASSAKADAQRDLRMTTADEFLAAAAKEYETGTIDRALWRQAADQHGRDVSLVIAAYLRARATALQARQKPAESAEMKLRGAGSNQDAMVRKVGTEPAVEIEPTDVPRMGLRGVNPKTLYSAGAVLAFFAAAAIVYLVVSLRQSESVRPPVAAAASPSANQPASPTLVRSQQPLVATSSRAGTNEGGVDALAATVRDLKIAGNWNVLVLYANEWTRKEPNNPAAWRELSVGYANLQQFNDALDAATRAVELSPEDALPWRNLGQINLTVDRLHEAGVAFGRALALNPDDADARCGAAVVAQRQEQPKDPNAVTRRVGPADGGCFTMSFGNAAVVSAGGTARKPASSAGR
jgi:cytochrome c-type biogenesis protein CcmH/NrfG